MPIVSSAPPSYQITTSVGPGGAQIYSTTSTTVGANTFNFAPGVTLGEVTVINTGSVACFLGQSGVNTLGVPLKPGEQITISGVGHVAKETGAQSWNLWAYTASGTTWITASLTTTDATS